MSGAGGVDVGFAVAQQAQRIAALEDLLRRNEGSLSAALARLKDVEVGLNAAHRAVAKGPQDLQFVLDELALVRRRADGSDHAWRAKAQELEGAAAAEARAHRPPPLSADPVFQRHAADVAAARQESADVAAALRRVADAAATDAKALRATEQDTKWVMDGLRECVAAQREFSAAAGRKSDALAAALQEETAQRERHEAHTRHAVDAAVRTLREEFAVRLEAEARARAALQGDVVLAFARMRDDVIKGFAQTAANLRHLDDASHSLETVLRAEVRSRLATAADGHQRLETVEDRVRREAQSAAEYLKAMDGQMSAALKDVREITAAECRAQLDRVWTAIAEAKAAANDNGNGGGGGNGHKNSSNSADSELALRRQQLHADAELAAAKSQILAEVDRRVAAAVPAAETFATRRELTTAVNRLDLAIAEAAQAAQRASANAAANGVTPATLDARLAAVDARIAASERDAAAAAAALLAAQSDLRTRAHDMDRQQQSVAALQATLSDAWARDQASMERVLDGIREQVLLMAEDQAAQAERFAAALAAAPGAASASAAAAGASTASSAGAAGEGGSSSSTATEKQPSVGSVVASRLLQQEVSSLRTAHKELEASVARQCADALAEARSASTAAAEAKSAASAAAERKTAAATVAPLPGASASTEPRPTSAASSTFSVQPSAAEAPSASASAAAADAADFAAVRNDVAALRTRLAAVELATAEAASDAKKNAAAAAAAASNAESAKSSDASPINRRESRRPSSHFSVGGDSAPDASPHAEEIEALQKAQRTAEAKMMKEVSALRLDAEKAGRRADDATKALATDVQKCRAETQQLRADHEQFKAALTEEIFPAIKAGMEDYVERAVSAAMRSPRATPAAPTPAGSALAAREPDDRDNDAKRKESVPFAASP